MSPDDGGYTCLHVAVQMGHVDMAKVRQDVCTKTDRKDGAV